MPPGQFQPNIRPRMDEIQIAQQDSGAWSGPGQQYDDPSAHPDQRSMPSQVNVAPQARDTYSQFQDIPMPTLQTTPKSAYIMKAMSQALGHRLSGAILGGIAAGQEGPVDETNRQAVQRYMMQLQDLNAKRQWQATSQREHHWNMGAGLDENGNPIAIPYDMNSPTAPQAPPGQRFQNPSMYGADQRKSTNPLYVFTHTPGNENKTLEDYIRETNYNKKVGTNEANQDEPSPTKPDKPVPITTQDPEGNTHVQWLRPGQNATIAGTKSAPKENPEDKRQEKLTEDEINFDRQNALRTMHDSSASAEDKAAAEKAYRDTVAGAKAAPPARQRTQSSGMGELKKSDRVAGPAAGPKLKPNFVYKSKTRPGKTFTTDAQGNPPPGE